MSESWLQWIFPSDLQSTTFENLHFTLRKLAHVTAYGILSYLNFRAMRGPRTGFRRAWSWVAVALALLIALIDELNQSNLWFRSGSPFDVMLDLAGALLAQVIIRLRSRVLFS